MLAGTTADSSQDLQEGVGEAFSVPIGNVAESKYANSPINLYMHSKRNVLSSVYNRYLKLKFSLEELLARFDVVVFSPSLLSNYYQKCFNHVWITEMLYVGLFP